MKGGSPRQNLFVFFGGFAAMTSTGDPSNSEVLTQHLAREVMTDDINRLPTNKARPASTPRRTQGESVTRNARAIIGVVGRFHCMVNHVTTERTPA